jgi:hypothetical protein
MSTTMNDLVGIGGKTLDATENTSVVSGLAGAGASFGELIKGVGKAVAETQLKLTENSAETTTKLATTLVEVIAVQETVYDDEGNITDSESHVQQLPLLNFVDPAFYHYPQVKIEGHFVMDSFATDTSSSVDTASRSFGGGFSLSRKPNIFGIAKTSASGGFSASSASSSTDLDVQTNQSTAVGRMRLYAQLTPQAGLGVPTPVQVVIGPSINIVEGPTTAATPESADPGANLVRTMSILLQLRDKEGKPIAKKALSIGVEGALWNFTDPAKVITGEDEADAGDLAIQVKRVFQKAVDAEHPVDMSPQPVTISVRHGLVVSSITRNL